MSSVINLANGPLFPTGITFIVGILFCGYIPHLSVPPQSIITKNICSSGTEVLNPFTASHPVSSTILSTISGFAPPPVI